MDFLQLPQPAARARQVDGVTFQALAQRQLAEQGQVFVLIVKHVDQIDEALLHGDRTVPEQWQVIDDPLVETLAQLQIIHHCRWLFTQIVEGERDSPALAKTGLKLALANFEGKGRRVGWWQVQSLTLSCRRRPNVMSLGKHLVRVLAVECAVVVGAADFHHLHARVDQLDYRFEARVIQRIGQQALGCIVGGHQQHDLPFEQGLEQPGDQHRVADVMHVKLVETQHLAIFQQLIQGDFQRVFLLAMTEHAVVQPSEELMEMQAAFARNRQRLEKTVEQPALTAPDGAVQVQTRRGVAAIAEQHAGLLRHAIDDLLLTAAEGVALAFGLVAEIIADRRGMSIVPGAGGQAFAEQAAQQRPALAQS